MNAQKPAGRRSPLFIGSGSSNIPKSRIPKKLGSVRTKINPESPGLIAYSNLIDPPSPFPQKFGLRYNISPWILGRLERLARARFEISELTPKLVDEWKNEKGINWILAQSVNASSEIEGENVQVDKLELIALPITEQPGKKIADPELEKRLAALRSIYDAYIWALCRKPEPIISLEFIIELHTKMFSRTQPDLSGRLKKDTVIISGGGYRIETLPAKKTELFLKTLCANSTRKWDDARRNAEHSTFLLIAEFVLDFLAIHPFGDGNGRTARLLSTYLLEKSGYHFARFYPVDYIILETRREYYQALFNGQLNWYTEREDLTPWIEYYTATVFAQWIRAYENVKEKHLKSKRGVKPEIASRSRS